MVHNMEHLLSSVESGSETSSATSTILTSTSTSEGESNKLSFPSSSISSNVNHITSSQPLQIRPILRKTKKSFMSSSIQRSSQTMRRKSTTDLLSLKGKSSSHTELKRSHNSFISSSSATSSIVASASSSSATSPYIPSYSDISHSSSPINPSFVSYPNQSHNQISPPSSPPISDMNLSSSSLSSSETRRVTYVDTCEVVLIPTRKEYAAADLDLWFTREDQGAAQTEVSKEVSKLLHDNPVLTIQDAMTYLFQPNSLEAAVDAVFASRSTPPNEIISQINYDSLEFNESLKSISVEADLISALESPKVSCHASPVKSFTDCKEKLDILIVDVYQSSLDATVAALRASLRRYDRWVMDFILSDGIQSVLEDYCHTTSSNHSGHARHTAPFDLILIDSNCFYELLEEKPKTDLAREVDRFLARLRNTFGRAVVIGMVMATSEDYDFVNTTADNEIRRASLEGGIDFVWDKPFLTQTPLIPIMLDRTEREKRAHRCMINTHTIHHSQHP